MSLIERWVKDGRWLQRVDCAVVEHRKHRLGWVLLDGTDPRALVWVHIRPYLHHPHLPPGFRIEEDVRPTPPLEILSGLEARSHYVLVIFRPPAGRLRPEVLQFLEDARRRRLPWFVVELADDPEACVLIGTAGQRLSLPEPALPRLEPLLVQFDGNERLEQGCPIPFDFQVSSDAPHATLSIRLLEAPALFPRHEYDYLIESSKRESLGKGVLRLDVKLRAGHRDELHVGPPRELSWQPRTLLLLLPPDRGFRPRKLLHLHLLFDRTTLDVDSWPKFLLAEERGRLLTEEEEAVPLLAPAKSSRPASPSRINWNDQLREAVAQALPACLPSLHQKVQIHLWWFADVPRDGIERSMLFPPLPVPWGRWGECALPHLGTVLKGEQFDYRPGLDLFDGVDEALAEIAKAVSHGIESSGEQHAVLIVGDSPPPPSGTHDPIWKHLVELPPLTNARRSPKFSEALDQLVKLKVQVGWLFLRSARAPARLEKYAELYGIFHSLKEQSLEALRKIEGLTVESCAGPEDIGQGLTDLFIQMERGEGRVPRFRIRFD